MAGQALLATITGEPFQPVRLHYKILDHSRVLRAFKKLRCLDHDPIGRRWVWLYDYEAKRLKFRQSYAQIAENLHPIVIGSFFIRSKETLLLDLRSSERAIQAIPFFDKHLPRNVVELGDAEFVNRLFPATQANMKLTPADIFDPQVSTAEDHEELVRQLLENTAGARTPAEKIEIAHSDLQSRSRKPLPEVERLPIHFAEDGIDGFKVALRLREIVAMRHWEGKPEYSMHDAIQLLLSHS